MKKLKKNQNSEKNSNRKVSYQMLKLVKRMESHCYISDFVHVFPYVEKVGINLV